MLFSPLWLCLLLLLLRIHLCTTCKAYKAQGASPTYVSWSATRPRWNTSFCLWFLNLPRFGLQYGRDCPHMGGHLKRKAHHSSQCHFIYTIYYPTFCSFNCRLSRPWFYLSPALLPLLFWALSLYHPLQVVVLFTSSHSKNWLFGVSGSWPKQHFHIPGIWHLPGETFSPTFFAA